MGGLGHALAGLLRSFFGERLDAARTEDGAVLIDDAEGKFRTTEVKGQNFTHRNRKGQSRAGREKSSCRRTTSVRSGVETSSSTLSSRASKRWIVRTGTCKA